MPRREPRYEEASGMTTLKKLRNSRGMTLAEVLLVVAIIAILLGLAMPDIIGMSRRIKRAEMDGYARSVAVAAQSKLYGMKNASTASAKTTYTILQEAAEERTLGKEEDEENVFVVRNFATSDDAKELENVNKMKHYLLSGAMTDTELLQEGRYVVVVVKAETADVMEVFYAEQPIDIDSLLPTVSESYLEANCVGLYLGAGAPEPESHDALPTFYLQWQYDDELTLLLQTRERIGEHHELWEAPLGLKVYARIPKKDASGNKVDGWDEILIYAEGYFNTDYQTTYAGTIQKDAGTLTLKKIYETSNPNYSEGGTIIDSIDSEDPENRGNVYARMKFSIDSLALNKANYGNPQTKCKLRHQDSPQNVSVAEPVLYPRESLANWFKGNDDSDYDPQGNPYLTVWAREEDGNAASFFGAKPVTYYVGVQDVMSLRVELHVLKRDEKGQLVTEKAKTNDAAELCVFDDETFPYFQATSLAVSPYFVALSVNNETANLASMREFNNLQYVFTTTNPISTAVLAGDITSQQLYEKLVSMRYALIAKDNSVFDQWGCAANWDSLSVDSMSIENGKAFTLDGCGHSLVFVGGNRDYSLGGYFRYACNCTFQNINIVNPKQLRNHYSTKIIKTNENGEITHIDPRAKNQIDGTQIDAATGIGGALVSIAENCRFENVHTYIDRTKLLAQENANLSRPDDVQRAVHELQDSRIEGIIAGGLVGLAIGDNDGKTTFDRCSASVILSNEIRYSPSVCLYAGGLVGVAMGNVSVENCYAACQISAYYAGGLIGATANGTWEYSYSRDTGQYGGDTARAGNLTVSKSFAAGYIQQLVRVAGGLIGQVSSSTQPDVTNCYSAVQWEALPPVAYGTFKGDKAESGNYYVVPSKVSVPLTANIGATFNCVGDVFSLQKDANGNAYSYGKPCTYSALDKSLFSGDGWTDATNTLQWSFLHKFEHEYTKNFYIPHDEETEKYKNPAGTVEHPLTYADAVKQSTLYPFPMPKGNTYFRGGWIEDCDKEAEDVGDSDVEFESFYYTRYDNGEEVLLRPNAGLITAITIDPNNPKDPNEKYKEGKWVEEKVEVKEEGGGSHTETVNKYSDEDYWVKNPNGIGQGISGATTVDYHVSESGVTTYEFYGAAFFIPGFDPVKGYNKYNPEYDEEIIDYGNTRGLLWDFYGFYYVADYGKRWHEGGKEADELTKYYIKYDEEVSAGRMEKREDGFIHVNEKEFETALSYTDFKFTVSDSDLAGSVQLQWNNNAGGYFEVVNVTPEQPDPEPGPEQPDPEPEPEEPALPGGGTSAEGNKGSEETEGGSEG